MSTFKHLTTFFMLLALYFGLTIAGPIFKRDGGCDQGCGGGGRTVVPRDEGLEAADELIDKTLVPKFNKGPESAPSRDECLKQLELYSNYTDKRCESYGKPIDLVNSYRPAENQH